METNILVGQSGGPTSAINSSLAGVISAGLCSNKISKVFGAKYGISGVIDDDLKELSEFSDDLLLKLLMQTPSAYLGSCRKKLPDYKEDSGVYEKIFNVFKKHSIKYFFYIGGNDSMDTVDKLSKYADIKGYDIGIIGIPKTIDNDLYATDHTPGYGSAAKFVANAVKEIASDNRVYDMNSVTIVEIMGRNAGWLAASAKLANDEGIAADIICLPEKPFNMDGLLDKIDIKVKEKKAVVVAISEGIKDEKGKFLCEYVSDVSKNKDIFNHVQMGGAGERLRQFVKEKLGYKVRNIELSTMQRCFSYCNSYDDIISAFKIGYEGVKCALKGETAVMMTFVRTSDSPYLYDIVPEKVSEIANLEKLVPDSMITKDGYDVTDEFVTYAKPLISGDFIPEISDGIIKTIRM